jgi:SAM-dependent methyltransferase
LLQGAFTARDSESAAKAIEERLSGPSGPAQFRERYARARSRKFGAFAQLLEPWLRVGTAVDLGAGGTDLLDALSTPSTRIAVDIELSEPLPGSRATLVKQTSPDRIPLPDDSADTVIATGVLHHIDAAVRRRLLADTARVLRPEGRLLLLEESFSATDQPAGSRDSAAQTADCLGGDPDVVAAQNDAFADLQLPDRMTFLAFTDWWGNRVMKGSLTIPLPYSFLTSEAWRIELLAAGLPVTNTRNLGLCSGGGHMASPRILFVCESR